MCQHFAGVAREQQQQIELLRSEVNQLPAQKNRMRGDVDDKIANLDGRVGHALRSPSEVRTYPRQQFLDPEGLGYVVIRARVQSFNLRPLLVAYREHQDRCLARSAGRAAKLDAGHAGHHQVGDHQIGRPFLKGPQRFFGIIRGAHVISLRRERRAQDPGYLRFIVDDQYAFRHGLSFCIIAPVMQKNTVPNLARVRRILLRGGGSTLLAFALVFLFRRSLHANQTTVALSFLVLILIAASRWRLTYSLYLSVLCAALYNFFFLPPVGTLVVVDPQNLVALIVFLCASFLVSHLSSRARREADLSEIRRGEVEHLYEFSQELLLHDDLSAVARVTPSIAAAIFEFRAVSLYAREEDATYFSDPDHELVPLDELKKTAEAAEPAVTLHNDVHVIPLLLGMRSMGAMAIRGRAQSPNVYEAIGTLVAIALERAAALERASHLEAARESERLHTALMDSVTHELRTPLTSIRAAATTLLSQPQMNEVERKEMYTVVDEESSRLDHLIGQAIEMAQLDAASIHVSIGRENVDEIIALALEEAQPLLGERSLEVQVPEGMPAVRLDRKLVRRVLRHLIENAVKYSPPGSPLRVAARVEGGRLLVSVEDFGPGIEEFEKPLIFRKFYRGRRQRDHISGTGMGLAIVKAILDAHGGGIDVQSRAGKGAQFTFWLPIEAAEAKDPGRRDEPGD